MNNIDFTIIEKKHSILIEIAEEYMKSVNDYEHNINHMNDVVSYTKELLNSLNRDIDIDVCIISAY